MIETKPRINRGNRGQLFRATWLSSARCSETFRRTTERVECSAKCTSRSCPRHGVTTNNEQRTRKMSNGLAFLISHLTRQRHFSGPLFVVRGHAMTWAGSGRDLGLSEVTVTCIWRNIRLARLFF